MASSDQTQLHVGDRVQDDQTGRSGRVVDLQFLPDGALLVTVALFIHGVLTGKVQAVCKRAQQRGFRWRKLVPATPGASQTAEITTPSKGTVSARAQTAARADQPPGGVPPTATEKAGQQAGRHQALAQPARQQRLTELKAEHDKLVAATKRPQPRLAAQIAREEARTGVAPSRALLDSHLHDPGSLRLPGIEAPGEQAVDTLFDQARYLRAQQGRFADQRGRIDQLLNYVTRRRPNSEGLFQGSFLADVIHAEGELPTAVTERLTHIEALLQGIPLDRTFVQNHPRLVRGEIRTVFDLLEHARATTLLEPTRRRQYALWREYGQLLSDAVRGSRPYQRLERRGKAFGEAARRRDDYAHAHWYSDPTVADRFNPVLDSADMGLLGRTEHQQFLLNQELFEGQAKGEIDLPGVAKDLALARRAAFNRGAGVQLRGARSGNNVPGVNLPDLFDLEKSRELRGSLFRLNGQTVRFTGAGKSQAVFQPVTRGRTLYASNFWKNPEEQLSLARRLSRGVKEIQPLDRKAQQMARAIATTKAVSLQGGLRGESAGLVDVPIHLLQGYMSGHLPGSDAELLGLVGGKAGLAALGFRDLAELRVSAASYGTAFGKKLFGSLPAASNALIREMEDGDLANTVWAGAFLHLRTLPQGLSLGQIEAKIGQRFASPKHLHELSHVLGTKGVGATPLSQIQTPAAIQQKLGRELGAEDLLSVLNGKPLMPGGSALSAEQAMSRPELKYRLEAFNRALDLRAKATLGDAFKTLDTPLAQKALARARTRFRLQEFQRQFELELGVMGQRGHHAAADLDELAETAAYLGQRIAGKKVTGGALNADLHEFANLVGLELMGGSPELNEAFARYKRNPTAETKRAYETAKEALYRQRFESQYVRRVRQLAADHAAQEAHPLTQSLGPYSHAVEAGDRAGFAAKLNPLIDLAEAGNPHVLIKSGHDFVLEPGGGIAVKLYGGPNKTNPYLYRRVGGPGSLLGEARNPLNPADAIGFGGDDRLLATRAELAAAQETGAFRALWHESHPLVKRRARDLARQAAHAELLREHQYVVQGNIELPFFQSGDGTVLGVWDHAPSLRGAPGVKGEQGIANTRELVENPASFLSLDIETDLRTGRITNLSAGKYRAQAGKLFSQGEGLDLATPALWSGASMGQASAEAERSARAAKVIRMRAGARDGSLAAGERGIMQNGRRTTIGEVVGSERTLIRRAAAYLDQHPEKIVGHNISFDVGSLADRAIALGMESEAQTFAAAHHRLVDTMLLAQAADPTAASYSLEWLSQKHLGLRKAQAHLAGPDQRQAAALYAKLAADPEAAARLAGAARQTAKSGTYLWDQENQFGYQLAGFVDAEATQAAIQQATGAKVPVQWGLALNPVRFTDGSINPAHVIEGTRTAAGFAGSFTSKYETVTAEQLRERMGRAGRDLAGRRARRLLADPNSFGQLLTEKARLDWARSTNKGVATQELLHQWATAGDPATQERLRRVHQWTGLLDDSAQGNRLAAQMTHVDAFFGAELAQHQPVVDWLAAHVNAAGADGVKGAEAQASQVWNEYIARSQGITDFAAAVGAPIPVGRQRLGLELPVLGRTVSVRTAAPEMARRDLDRVTIHVAKRLEKEGELAALFSSFSGAEVNEFKQRLRADRMLLDNDLGRKVREHIFERHLAPAMEQGFTQRDLAGEQFAVHAPDTDAAIDQIVSQGAEVVQRRIESAKDYLAGRHFADGQLEALQGQMMGGQSVAHVAAGLEAIRRKEAGQLPDLFLSARHGVPHEWVGREVSDVLLQGKQLQGPDAAGFTHRVGLLRQGMRGLEKSLLDQKLRQGGFHPQQVAGRGANLWDDAVPHAFQFTPTLENAQRVFKPGTANHLGLDFMDDIANQAGRLKSGRNIALALIGGAVVMAAVSRPKGLAPHGPTGKDAGLSSTPGEIHDRGERQQRQAEKSLHSQPLTQKIRVSIEGEDPVGVNHTELVQSIHQALGTFVQQDVSHAPDVRDRRAKIDRNYLQDVAAHLLAGKK